jgi:hypothetical protein
MRLEHDQHHPRANGDTRTGHHRTRRAQSHTRTGGHASEHHRTHGSAMHPGRLISKACTG